MLNALANLAWRFERPTETTSYRYHCLDRRYPTFPVHFLREYPGGQLLPPPECMVTTLVVPDSTPNVPQVLVTHIHLRHMVRPWVKIEWGRRMLHFHHDGTFDFDQFFHQPTGPGMRFVKIFALILTITELIMLVHSNLHASMAMTICGSAVGTVVPRFVYYKLAVER